MRGHSPDRTERGEGGEMYKARKAVDAAFDRFTKSAEKDN